MGWTDIKPEFKDNCILVTADINRGLWDFHIWEIKQVNFGDGPYMAWLDHDGEEYGDLEDLKADKYLILPPL